MKLFILFSLYNINSNCVLKTVYWTTVLGSVWLRSEVCVSVSACLSRKTSHFLSSYNSVFRVLTAFRIDRLSATYGVYICLSDCTYVSTKKRSIFAHNSRVVFIGTVSMKQSEGVRKEKKERRSVKYNGIPSFFHVHLELLNTIYTRIDPISVFYCTVNWITIEMIS